MKEQKIKVRLNITENQHKQTNISPLPDFIERYCKFFLSRFLFLL